MPREVDSGALEALTRALGLAGRGAPLTELLDGTLSQVIDVEGIVRRSRTILPTEGITSLVTEHVHAGAGQLTTTFSPYGPGFVPIPPYPDNTQNYDIWVYSVRATTQSGGGNFVGMQAEITGIPLAATVAAAASDPGARWTLGVFDDELVMAGLNTYLREAGTGKVNVIANVRIPRGCFLRIRSQASGAATYRIASIIGVFPRGLGQDGAF